MSPDLTRAEWRKATRSQNNGNCVEVAILEGTIAVRDSKNPDSGALIFTRAEWDAFLHGAKNGEFDPAI